MPAAPSDILAAARERWYQGDAAGTVTVLSPWLDGRAGPFGRERTAGHLLLGLAHMQLGNWNLASANFYRVRASGDPLAPFGAWYEAVVDNERGRHSVAIKECSDYRDKWPDGLDADECLVLIGEAWADLGKPGPAVSAFQTWLDHNPDTPRTEEIALAKAVAVARTSPAQGIPMLQELVLTHTFPSTAVGAQQALDELAAQGLDTRPPQDRNSQERLASSLRRSGRLVDAWELFSKLQAQAEAVGKDGQPLDPALRQWVDDNEDSFAWGTRQFDVYVAKMLPDYEAAPSARLGWQIFRAYARGGMYDQAATWGARMLEDWGGRDHLEEVAFAFLHAGRYDIARGRFQALASTGGKVGRDARFYASFAAFRSGALDVAIDELTAQADGGGDWAAAACWWISRAWDAKGDAVQAAHWRQEARERDDTGWYRLLADDHDWRAAGSPLPPSPPDAHTETNTWLLRDGRWHGHQPAALAQAERARTDPLPGTDSWPAAIALLEPTAQTGGAARPALLSPEGNPGWAALRWEGHMVGPSTEAVADPGTDTVQEALPVAQELLPDGYGACTWYDPASAEDTFAKQSEALKDILPDLPAAFDLARAGLAVEAGRILRADFDTWDQARGRGDPLSQRLQTLSVADWRQMSIYARQAHLSYRLCIGLDKGASDPADLLSAWRLAWPMVHTPELWRSSRQYGVDPFLVMGLMRQESRYQDTVVSSAGAIGLVQVMPRTGAKVAALLGEGRYSPAALEDPSTNIRYGVYYLSLLLQRFDGVFPLAVASYNGGPHNVSRWYRPWTADGRSIDLDVLVEQLEYDESRDYVKKVTGFYSTYVQLYGPPGARVVLPTHPAGDDASVVDF